jgi:leucyl aminopeptidase
MIIVKKEAIFIMILRCFSDNEIKMSIPIEIMTPDAYVSWSITQSALVQKWLESHNFLAKPNTYSLIPSPSGLIDKVIVIVQDLNQLNVLGLLSITLPQGDYGIISSDQALLQRAGIAWGKGAYQFSRYKKPKDNAARLSLKGLDDACFVIQTVESIYLVRDLINTPAQDMTPQALAEVSRELAARFNAQYQEIMGEDLITANFPAIYAVGKGSDNPPYCIEFEWGNAQHPHLVLIGKGVCFDSGGYDLKSSGNMRWMKKDMGGAAHVLGLAQLIMAQNLPIRLTVLIGAVENLVSGSAYKPGDVVMTRKGLSIEIGNTDAEGRVVLSDLLTYALEKSPQLMIDFATLTGAARVALGTDLPALFANQDKWAQDLQALSFEINDPLWRMPLYAPYRELIESPIADISNDSASPYGGAITAALFLATFVDNCPWMHIDVMAWNPASKPAAPQGGEAMGIQAVFEWLKRAPLVI